MGYICFFLLADQVKSLEIELCFQNINMFTVLDWLLVYLEIAEFRLCACVCVCLSLSVYVLIYVYIVVESCFVCMYVWIVCSLLRLFDSTSSTEFDWYTGRFYHTYTIITHIDIEICTTQFKWPNTWETLHLTTDNALGCINRWEHTFIDAYMHIRLII